MNFKNKEEYLQLRNTKMVEAENLTNESKIQEAEIIIAEIETLDNQWEEDAKELANKSALENKLKGLNVSNISQKSNVRSGKVGEGMNNEILNDLNSVEYRKAFMNYVVTGSMSSAFSNVDANTKTTDVSVTIPTTVLEKIVEKMEAIGMILPLVTRTAIKGGVSVPTSSVKPVATWVAEGATSDRQKKTTGSITFSYYKLRCSVSVSLEVDTMALPVFEAALINNVAEAMVKAIEQAILLGTGVGQPKGILLETPATGQQIDIAKASSIDYNTLVNAEAALPLAYEKEAVWLMTKKTFMAFIGLVDSQKQPIARVNYGISGRPERTLLGRPVILNDYMESYVVTPTADNKFAALFNLKDYVLNTNLDITMKRFEDNNTDDQVTKAIMLVDGKAIDTNSLVILTHKNA